MDELGKAIEAFLLPEGFTYDDMNDGSKYAKPRDLLYVPLVGVALYILRLIYERSIAIPFGKSRHLQDGAERKPAQQNAILDQYFRQNKKAPSEEAIQNLSRQLNWPVSSVKRWFRRKRNWNRPSILQKFCETSWRFVFYTFLFTYGMFTLWQEPWFWDHRMCWIGYPQEMDQLTFYYYMLEAGFYVSLLFSVMRDIKRKDFTEQLIHHVSTLSLILFSYAGNFLRMGTLVMAVHDISDIFLEGAKCLHYHKLRTAADATFVVFAIVFFVTRLFIYPFWILHTAVIKPLDLVPRFPSHVFFNFFLVVLLCLHIFWGSIILKMAYYMCKQGEVQDDDRSDIEEESSDEEEVAKKES